MYGFEGRTSEPIIAMSKQILQTKPKAEQECRLHRNKNKEWKTYISLQRPRKPL
jgi:hypothetical protein